MPIDLRKVAAVFALLAAALKSWHAAEVEKVEQIDGKKGKEWKVSFKNWLLPTLKRAHSKCS